MQETPITMSPAEEIYAQTKTQLKGVMFSSIIIIPHLHPRVNSILKTFLRNFNNIIIHSS